MSGVLHTAAGLGASVSHATAAIYHHHRHLKHSGFDYAGLAVGAFASWVGVPGPGEPLLVAAGLLASKGKLSIGIVLLVAWAAATLGGIIGWLVGLRAGRVLVTFPGPLLGARERALDRGEQVFARYLALAILLTPSWIAGINRVRPAVFLPVNAAAAALWTLGFGLGAYEAGPTVLDAAGDIGKAGLILLVGLVMTGLIVERVRRRRRQPAD